MNPYDRRAVEQVWRRVCPDRDVFAKGGKPPEALPELTVGQQLLLLAQGYAQGTVLCVGSHAEPSLVLQHFSGNCCKWKTAMLY